MGFWTATNHSTVERYHPKGTGYSELDEVEVVDISTGNGAEDSVSKVDANGGLGNNDLSRRQGLRCSTLRILR